MSDDEEFVVGPDGVARWGVYGAAGQLLRHTRRQRCRPLPPSGARAI